MSPEASLLVHRPFHLVSWSDEENTVATPYRFGVLSHLSQVFHWRLMIFFP